jgi:hypothetical protein
MWSKSCSGVLVVIIVFVASNWVHLDNLKHDTFLVSADVTDSLKMPFKIFVYPIPEKLLLHVADKSGKIYSLSQNDFNNYWCNSDGYSIEHDFPNLLKNEPSVLTLDPEQATLFYIPLFPVCIYHSARFTWKVDSDSMHYMVHQYNEKIFHYVLQNWKYLHESQGRNHVVSIAHDARCMFLFSGSHNFIKKMIAISPMGQAGLMQSVNASILDRIIAGPIHQSRSLISQGCVNEDRDVVVPSKPTSEFVSVLNRARIPSILDRATMIHFRGTIGPAQGPYSFGLRSFLSNISTHQNVEFHGLGTTPSQYVHELLNSKFCLSLYGWNPWSSRLSYILFAECIPVIVADSIGLPFERTIDWSAISIKVSHQQVLEGSLINILKGCSNITLMKKQANIRRLKHKLVFNFPKAQKNDAFWNIISELKILAKNNINPAGWRQWL